MHSQAAHYRRQTKQRELRKAPGEQKENQQQSPRGNKDQDIGGSEHKGREHAINTQRAKFWAKGKGIHKRKKREDDNGTKAAVNKRSGEGGGGVERWARGVG